MNTELTVFIIGSAASFWPLYRVLGRLFAMHRKRLRQIRGSAPFPLANRDFLSLLRQEAIFRARTTLRDALADARTTTGKAKGTDMGLGLVTGQQITETQRLVASLFPTDIQNIYDGAVEEVGAATNMTLHSASIAVARAIAALDAAADGELTSEREKIDATAEPRWQPPAFSRISAWVQQTRASKIGRSSTDDKNRFATHPGHRRSQSSA